jgi:hypothetical protein
MPGSCPDEFCHDPVTKSTPGFHHDPLACVPCGRRSEPRSRGCRGRATRASSLPSPAGHIRATGRDAKRRKQCRYHERWREYAMSASRPSCRDSNTCPARTSRRPRSPSSAQRGTNASRAHTSSRRSTRSCRVREYPTPSAASATCTRRPRRLPRGRDPTVAGSAGATEALWSDHTSRRGDTVARAARRSARRPA